MSRLVRSIDIETTGTDPWRDKITMVGVFDGSTYRCFRTREAFRDYLSEDPDFDWVMHRADFDTKFLLVHEWITQEDIASRIVHDSQVLAHLVKHRVPKSFLEWYEAQRKELNKTLPKGQSHREGKPLSLKVLAPWYLKVPPFWETPGNYDNEEYNEKDCRYTLSLFSLLSGRVQAEGSWDFYLRLLEWSKMIRSMEMRGICIDPNELTKVEDEYTKKRDSLKSKLDVLWMGPIHQYAVNQQNALLARYQDMEAAQIAKGKDPAKMRQKYFALYNKALPNLEAHFNYNSDDQMAWLLRDYLGLDIKNFEGKESTAKDVLNRLANQGHEDIKTYLEFREAEKILTMYVAPYREMHVDGVIHCSLNIVGTRTGRTSCANPNLQQVPEEFYRVFRSRPGHKLIQRDLSGIEAALIALYSGDKTLFEILDKGLSIHDYNTLYALFDLKCDVSEVKKRFPRERDTSKKLGFAVFYGAGWKRIKQVFLQAGYSITDAEAKKKLAKLKELYAGAFAFHKEITEVFAAGETVHNLCGRPINLQPHDNPYMQGFNTLIQSSASDLNLMACERFWKSAEGQAYPLVVIHDCIIGEAPDEHAEYASTLMNTCMTDFNLNSINGLIKLQTEGAIANEWQK